MQGALVNADMGNKIAFINLIDRQTDRQLHTYTHTPHLWCNSTRTYWTITRNSQTDLYWDYNNSLLSTNSTWALTDRSLVRLQQPILFCQLIDTITDRSLVRLLQNNSLQLTISNGTLTDNNSLLLLSAHRHIYQLHWTCKWFTAWENNAQLVRVQARVSSTPTFYITNTLLRYRLLWALILAYVCTLEWLQWMPQH